MARHSFYDPQADAILRDLDSVNAVLGTGARVHILEDEDKTRGKELLAFPRPKDKTFGAPGFWVHGLSTDSLETVLSYLDGDAHDVSKVQWFNGSTFFDIASDPNAFAR